VAWEGVGWAAAWVEAGCRRWSWEAAPGAGSLMEETGSECAICFSRSRGYEQTIPQEERYIYRGAPWAYMCKDVKYMLDLTTCLGMLSWNT
jgi:hypothetical protein